MKDPDFIQQQIQKGTEAKEKVNAELSVLTTKQLIISINLSATKNEVVGTPTCKQVKFFIFLGFIHRHRYRLRI